MMNLGVTMLSEGAKVGAKVGSKLFFGVAGSLAGFGLSNAVMPAMRKSMDDYMSKKFGEEAWKNAQATGAFTEEMQAEVNWYNIEATVVNGLCNAVGAVGASLADFATCKTIDRSDVKNNNNFLIGNKFTI